VVVDVVVDEDDHVPSSESSERRWPPCGPSVYALLAIVVGPGERPFLPGSAHFASSTIAVSRSAMARSRSAVAAW
jgi:hypothetical protein